MSVWDDLLFEQRREDERAPEWHPWDEKVFEDPAPEKRPESDDV